MKTKYDIVLVVGFVIIFSIFSTLYQPFQAEAHNGTSLSGFASTPPKIDGSLLPNEWAHAQRHDFVTIDNKVSGTIYVMNDKTNLYIALSIKDKSDSIRSKMIFFDNNHTGKIQNGDSVWDFSGGLTEAHITSAEPYTENWSPDHHIDGSSAASADSFYNYVELSHPLCSHNRDDFCLVAGQTIGFTMRFSGDYAVHEWPGSLETKDDNALGWGDIVVARPSLAYMLEQFLNWIKQIFHFRTNGM